MSDSTLKELWQQVAEKKNCEAKQKELTAQRDTLADRLKKLEKSKLAEQADVDRLEGHSLAAFFYQVIGKMDEKLDKERQEAYAARVKYDAALHDLSSVDADLDHGIPVFMKEDLLPIMGDERMIQELPEQFTRRIQ